MDSILPEYEITELPSRFIPYPEGTKIYVQPYSYGAALNIELVGRRNINTMKEILQGVKVEGIAKNLLTPQDILFIGVYRNLVSSKHDKITISSICPNCLKENKSTKTLKEIKFEQLEGFSKDVYPLEVDFDNYTMWFGFLTYKDFDFCLTRYNASKIHQQALQVLKYTVKETGETFEKPEYNAKTGKQQDTAKIEKYVEKVRHILYGLVDEDADALREVIDLLENYGLKPIEIQCEDELCGKTYEVNVDDDNVLILPFRDTTKPARDRIKLSKSTNNEPDSFETDELKGSGYATGVDTKTSSQETSSTESVVEHKKAHITLE